MLVNETLMYIDQHRHRASKDSIIQVTSTYYSQEELNKAKDKLIGAHGDHINAERKKARKDSQNRTEKMKVSEDIIDALFDVEHLAHLMCVAEGQSVGQSVGQSAKNIT